MSVNVIPEGPDELTRARVRAQVASILDDLVGRPAASLDPALVSHLPDGRTLTIEGPPVYLSVRAVVIGETEFWVELRVAPAEDGGLGGYKKANAALGVGRIRPTWRQMVTLFASHAAGSPGRRQDNSMIRPKALMLRELPQVLQVGQRRDMPIRDPGLIRVN